MVEDDSTFIAKVKGEKGGETVFPFSFFYRDPVVQHSFSKLHDRFLQDRSGLGGNPQLAGLKALETVGEFSAQELGAKLAELWGKGQTIMIFVEGVKSFGDVDRVKKHFAAQPGVTDLALRLYDENMAQFEVQLGGITPAELAGRMESSQSLKLKVLESSNQIIRLKME